MISCPYCGMEKRSWEKIFKQPKNKECRIKCEWCNKIFIGKQKIKYIREYESKEAD